MKTGASTQTTIRCAVQRWNYCLRGAFNAGHPRPKCAAFKLFQRKARILAAV